MTAGPMCGVRILDLTQMIVGPYATKLMADYGADVIKVERPAGDPARRLKPFQGDVPSRETSGTFFYFNTNKRSIVLNLKSTGGREVFWRLLDRADIIVESFRPGVMDELGIGWQAIQQRGTNVPLVSISNFGQTGPYRDYKGADLVLYGFAGEMYAVGVNEREPVKMYGTASLVESGAAASTAIMGALLAVRRNGVGEHVDFSVMESQLGGVDRRHLTAIAWEYNKKKAFRPNTAAAGMAAGVYPCADGYIDFNSAYLRLDRIYEMLGQPEWLTDSKWKEPNAHLDPELIDEFNSHFYAWLMERTKSEVWQAAREAKVLCAPLFTVAELFHDPHFRERGFWARAEHPAMGHIEFPGRPFVMSRTPWNLRRPAPLLGQHTCEVMAEAGYGRDEIRTLLKRQIVEAF